MTIEELKKKRTQFARANPKYTDLIREFNVDLKEVEINVYKNN